MDIESSKERCASLSKNPEDYLCEEEDAVQPSEAGFSATQRANDQRNSRASERQTPSVYSEETY